MQGWSAEPRRQRARRRPVEEGTGLAQRKGAGRRGRPRGKEAQREKGRRERGEAEDDAVLSPRPESRQELERSKYKVRGRLG